MKKGYRLLVAGVILLLFVMLSIFILFGTSNPLAFFVRYQSGEVNFAITPEKNYIKEGEIFKIQLNLTNVGDKKIRVWELEEQISYNIIFSDPKGYSVPYMCGIIERVPLTDKNLVDLSPGDSTTAIRDSSCWNLTKGEYSLSAVYHTGSAETERITIPYWLGTAKSNNITIFVQ